MIIKNLGIILKETPGDLLERINEIDVDDFSKRLAVKAFIGNGLLVSSRYKIFNNTKERDYYNYKDYDPLVKLGIAEINKSAFNIGVINYEEHYLKLKEAGNGVKIEQIIAVWGQNYLPLAKQYSVC